MGARRLTARLSYCEASLGAAGPSPKYSAEFLECREFYLRFPMRHKKFHVHYKNILNYTGTRFYFFGTDVQSGNLLPRCKLPNIDSFKERTKERVLN
jgi:hypothetical protein